MPISDRRAHVLDTAIEIIARDGVRALTHRAIDTALALPAGSTSYYFRTRHALLTAIVDRITLRSRADFRDAFGGRPPAVQAGTTVADTATEAATAIGSWLDALIARRRADVVARYALALELRGDSELHERLMRCLFSAEHATELCTELGIADPTAAAADLLAVLDGAVFDRVAGARGHLSAGTPESAAELTALVSTYLHGATRRGG